jgi:hypothetical protein
VDLDCAIGRDGWHCAPPGAPDAPGLEATAASLVPAMPPRKKRIRAKAKPAPVRAPKLYRPTIERRLDKTEAFFARVVRMAERRMFAHNLKRPAAEDHSSVELIGKLRDLAKESRGKVRQPSLAL